MTAKSEEWEGFTAGFAAVNGQTIYHQTGGAGAPLLLLHGFPQTHAMWHQVALNLARDFRVTVADLRGYGDSSKPQGTEAYSFRHMAADQNALMQSLGHARYHVIGHDRGGRVAHRLALDAPGSVHSLTLMDIVPTHFLLNQLSHKVAAAYYHWFFLAQPFPFAEAMIADDPDRYFESCLLGWGAAKMSDFAPNALEAYRRSWRDTDTIRGMCADYRAALEVDFDLDAADLDRKIEVPTLIAYGTDGAMAQAYDVPATWRDRLTDMHEAAIPGGHFFIDQSPDHTIETIRAFLPKA
ncbi:MAG: alpha/beta fold hydrolase [Roseobacter sp.]